MILRPYGACEFGDPGHPTSDDVGYLLSPLRGCFEWAMRAARRPPRGISSLATPWLFRMGHARRKEAAAWDIFSRHSVAVSNGRCAPQGRRVGYLLSPLRG